MQDQFNDEPKRRQAAGWAFAILKGTVPAAHALLLLVFVGAETRCAPGTPPPAVPLKSTIEPVKTAFAPPTWAARFAKPAGLVQCTSIDERSRLCVGALGERWLDGENGAYASPYLASEDLVAALPDSKTWIFVGRRGTLYAAESPLGAFTGVRRPPRDFTQFAVQSGQWFGITSEGELWRGALTDGQGARANVAGRLFSLGIAPNGTGLAVAAPEQLWLTRDNGGNWTHVDAGPFGTRSVTVDEQGSLLLSTALPATEITLDGVPARTTQGFSHSAVELKHTPRQYPETLGITEGRSAHLGKDILELRNIDGNWYLGRGPLDGPFTFTKVDGLDEFMDVRFANSGKSSIVIGRQGRPHSDVESLTVLLSNGQAEHFVALGEPIRGKFRDVRLVAGGSHRFFVTGLCGTHGSMHDRCSTAAPFELEVTGASPRNAGMVIRPVPVPGTMTTALVLAASADYSRIAFVAHGPGSPWHVYLSTDSGATFSTHSIDDIPVTSTPPRTEKTNAPAVRESREILSLQFGEDQSLSLVYRNGDAPVIVNFDARGGLVATAMAPAGVSRADAVGSRILAYSRSEGNVYESLDRGASFELVAHLPGSGCPSWLVCDLRCTPQGCLIGDRFTRLGWGGRGLSRLDVAVAPETAATEPQPKSDAVFFRTPISCKIRPGEPSGTSMPMAPLPEQVGLRESLWLSPWQEWTTASAGAYRVIRGSRRIEKTTAFPALAHPERAGLAVTSNDSGIAYLRSENLPKIDEPLGDLELSWMPAGRSTWSRARFRDAATFKNDDSYLYGVQKARKLLPEVLSVSKNDAFVQVHANDERTLGTYFVSNGKAQLVPRIPWPFPAVRDAHWLKDGDAWRVYAFDDTGTELVRALGTAGAKDATWTFSAQTLLEPFGAKKPPRERVQPHFSEPRPYLVLAFTTREHQWQSLSAHEFGAGSFLVETGAPLALPESLSEPPPACNERDRRELKRVVVPLLPAAARVLSFTDGKGRSHWLVASQAVMYATERRTCIDTVWAETLPGFTPMRAVVPLEDTSHSWIFLSGRAHGETHVEARPVECRLDATTTPPPELQTRTQARFNVEHLPLE